jgi:hypothetical protein
LKTVRLQKALLLSLLSITALSAYANDIKYSFELISYAGPMPILQLANDWHGDIKSGRDAIFFLENKIQTTTQLGATSNKTPTTSAQQDGYNQENSIIFSILSRTYHEFLIGNDLARGFYYDSNDIALDNELRIDASMHAKSYSGEGIQLGYEFNFSPFNGHSFIWTPTLTALRLTDVIWGSFEGQLFYSNTDDWGGTIDLDYLYSEDHVARRPLEGKYIGQLYGLDFDISYQSKYFSAHYKGINVMSRIYWDGVPATTAQISTETAFFLLGYEYFDDVILDAPALHHSRIALPLNEDIYGHGVSLRTDGYFTAIREFHFQGIEWKKTVDWFSEPEDIIYSIQYDFAHSSSKVSFEHPNFSATFASQTLDVSKSQQLIINLSLGCEF